MLRSLSILNLAIIESMEVQPGEGLIVLAGETGAGKSLLIQAIKALSGRRISKDMIRRGADFARVEAVFDAFDTFLPTDLKEDLYPEGIAEDDVLILSREIQRNGRSTCRVNGRMVPLKFLEELGQSLMEIHGQHETQQLFDAKRHMDILDRYGQGRIAVIKAQYERQFRELLELKKKAKRLVVDPEKRQQLTLRLKQQKQLLDRVNPQVGEEEALLKRRRQIERQSEVFLALSQVEQALSQERESAGMTVFPSTLSELDRGVKGLERAASLLREQQASKEPVTKDEAIQLNDIEELRARLAKLVPECYDLAAQLNELLLRFDQPEEQRRQIDERLSLIERLKDRFRMDFDEVILERQKIEQALKQLDDSIPEMQRLAKLEQESKEALKETAMRLSEARHEVAEELSLRITAELKALEMHAARFSCQFEKKVADIQGTEHCAFLFSGNHGEALAPLADIASGGEASRIMLAIKSVLAEVDATPILVFDEVDTGISGYAAKEVAKRLSQLAQGRQVLCVSHQAQVFAYADEAFMLKKRAHEERTISEIFKADEDLKRSELSRLLGAGVSKSSSEALAQELFKEAKRDKEARK